MKNYYDYFQELECLRGKKVNEYPGFNQDPSIYVTSGLEIILPYAHYSDDRFKEAQVVFCNCNKTEFKKLSWDYSDRMDQYDSKKAQAATDYAKAQGYKPRTAGWWKSVCDYFYDGEVELRAIATGFNGSNGYDYTVVGYLKK